MNADSHDVVLFSGAPDYNIVREEENVTGMSHTFTDVAAGSLRGRGDICHGRRYVGLLTGSG